MIGYEILLYLGSSIFSMYSLKELITAFLDKREFNSQWVSITISLLYLTVLTMETIIIPPGYVLVFINLFLAMMICYLYNGKFTKKLSISIIWLLLGVVFEILVVYTIGILFNISAGYFQQNAVTKVIGPLIVNLILMITAILLKKIINKSNKYEKLLFINSIYVLITPIISIIIFTCLFYLTINISGVIQTFVAIILIGIIIINIFAFYFIEKANESRELRLKYEILNTKTKYYLESEKNIIYNTEQIRKLKHDLKHKFLYIKNRLDENSNEAFQEISNYINDIVGNISNENLKNYTKNININNLLNHKFKEAAKNKINLEIKILVSENIELNTDVLYVVLGNLIDNAIENYDDQNSKLKVIEIIMIEDKGNLLIEINNPYSKLFKSVDGLPTTTKLDNINHGLGLLSVKRIVNDENGIFNWSVKDNIFTVELILFKK